jgi:hypothetical protein
LRPLRRKRAGGETPARKEIGEELDAASWSALLEAELDSTVEVRFSRARRTVLRVQRRRGALRVHMHSFFAHAPIEIRQHVIHWLRGGKRARNAMRDLDLWIESELVELWKREPLEVSLSTRGRVHDLDAIARELFEGELRRDFAGAARPRLTWGRAVLSKRRRTLRLGSYDYHSGVVRVHPVLDQRAVPAFFVRYIVHHELLHAALPCERGADARRILHGPTFKAREGAFADTQRALAWEKVHLKALLKSARTGEDMRVSASMRPERARTGTSRAARLVRWVQGSLFASPSRADRAASRARDRRAARRRRD